MEDFTDMDDDFLLVSAERISGMRTATTIGLYLLLLIVVVVTGAHGIMLTTSESTAYDASGGLFAAVLNMVRISFPVTVEIAAIVAGLGFITSQWRKGQKAVGSGIEVVWFLFAAANMITMFRIERGLPMEPWQEGWVNYGLPLSALVAGVLVYSLKRTDPDHRRAAERTAAIEKGRSLQFAAKREVALSPQMRQIEKQRQWQDFVNQLRLSGRYTEDQIQFILKDTPELMVDKNHDGIVDLLQPGIADFEDSTEPAITQPQTHYSAYQNGRSKQTIGGDPKGRPM